MNEQELLTTLQQALHDGEYHRVEDLAKEAVKTYPEAAFGYAYLAESLLMDVPTRYAEAELCLAKASQLDPDNTAYMAQFAALKATQGDESAAQLLWGKILILDPQHQEALLAKGRYQLYNNDDYEQALELFNQVLSLDLDYADGYLYRAEAYLGLEAHEKALNDVEQALQLQGDAPSVSALLLQIEILLALGNKAAAATQYDLVLQQDGDNPFHRVSYGQLLLELGRPADAAEQLGQASETLAEGDPMVAYLWGDALYQSGQYDKAATAYSAYIEHSEDPTEGLLMRMDCYAHTQAYDLMLADADRLNALAADNRTLQDQVTVKRAQALIGLRRFEEARELLTPLAQRRSLQQGAALYLIGMLEHQQGNGPQAYKFVNAARRQLYAPADAYLKRDLSAVEASLLAKVFELNAKGIAANVASSFIQQISGKVWVYKEFQSQKLSEFSSQQIANIKQSLSSYTVVVSARLVLLLSEQSETLATYRLQKEAASGALVELLPLDNTAPATIKLQLTKQGWLTYSKEKGEIIVLEGHAPDALPAAVADLLRRNFSAERMGHLGDGFDALGQALF